MASSPRTKLRIAASVLFATGFFDAIAGRFLWQWSVVGGQWSVKDGSVEKTDTANRKPSPATSRPPDLPTSRPLTTGHRPPATALRGALHIHSNYSDGAGDIPTVMEGAKEAAVDFVLLTDHNSQQPLRDGWEQRYEGNNGYPLLLIGTEVTVENGAFLLALDMPPEWEPTKGQPPQEAIDEVNAHHGLPLVSLPFDIKHPWEAWDASGCRGLEVINLSTVARRHINIPSLLWLVTLGRLKGTMAALRALLTRPDAALDRWDRLTDDGTLQVGIGALDAHALMKIGSKKYPIPNYADSMRVLTTHVLVPPEAQTGEPARRAIYDALRRGRCYMVYDCLGDPRPFTFRGRTSWEGSLPGGGTTVAEMGDSLVLSGEPGDSITLEARSADNALLRLYHKGRVVAAGIGSLCYRATEPGAYRVEAYRFGFRLGPLFVGVRPWAFSNPIYVTR